MTPHGSPFTYTNYRCRCEACREAHRLYTAQARLLRAERGVPDPAMHGKASTYTNWSCRCDACKAAWAESGRRYRAAEREAES